MEHSPFRIQSGQTTTEVLGTSFNIRAYPEEKKVELTVETGIVAFSRANAPETRLEVKAAHRRSLKKIAMPFFNPGRRSTMRFPGIPENWFSKMQPLKRCACPSSDFTGSAWKPRSFFLIWNCHFTGSFEKAPPAELAQTVAFSLNLDLHQRDSVYTFTGKGCGGK